MLGRTAMIWGVPIYGTFLCRTFIDKSHISNIQNEDQVSHKHKVVIAPLSRVLKGGGVQGEGVTGEP